MKTRSLIVAFLGAISLLGTPAENRAAESAAPAAAPAVKRTVLRRVEVPNSAHEVVVVLVEVPANTSAGRHTHPGSVVGYLLEGTYTMLIDGQPPKALKVGDSVEVPSGVPHDERSGDAPAKLLAVFTVEKGKPLTSPAPLAR